MATVAPPPRNDISGTAPNPSNAVARAGFGALWDYVTNLLGVTGSPETACTALGAYQKTSILGTVSQSGGVPTGAIIETGSNANGTFTKWADGRMECTRTVALGSTAITTANGSLFVSAAKAGLSYAASFIAPPPISHIQVISVNANAWMVTEASPTSTTSQSFYLFASTSSTQNITVTLLAIGRWF